VSGGVYGILQSAGLLFFAFAGYARIATLGEEVIDPERTIPRAILIALGGTVVVYGTVAVTLLGMLGPAGVAASAAPLGDVVAVAGWSWAEPVVRVGAAAASLGALLALIAGVGRTTLAMARESDVPRWLSAVHPRTLVPHRAEIAVALAAILIVAVADVRGAIGFSSFGVLVYYSIANAAALTQPPEHRRFPRILAVIGVIGCVALVATLPWQSVVGGVAMIAVGLAYRALSRPRSAPNTP
jgi:APA family basic amino acid/polyamine antiporter